MKNSTLIVATSIAALAAGTFAFAQTATPELAPADQVIMVDADGNATLETNERSERRHGKGDRDGGCDRDGDDHEDEMDDDEDHAEGYIDDDADEVTPEATTGADNG